MIIGDKVTIEEKKKLGIHVYDAYEVNDDKAKRLEVMKKLQKHGLTLGDNEFEEDNQKVQEKEKNTLAKFLFKSIYKKYDLFDIIFFR